MSSLEYHVKRNKQISKQINEFATLWVKKRQSTYFICPSCKGKGFQRSFIKFCRRCDGRGYVDWIRRIFVVKGK